MISYAQNREDVVLARLFDSDEGFYVDVGAWLPVVDSVTKHFSDRGWHGINVEPLPDEYALLCADRRRDRCVQAAITDRTGMVELHVPTNAPGRSTTEPAVAAEMPASFECTTIEVPSLRLCDLLEREDVERVDFLKIDVEGAEAAIVNDTDWRAIRPRVLVIEATWPGRPDQTHGDWEPTLLAAGYRCLLFDGLNRFYADEHDEEAAAALSTPANALDDVELHVHLSRVRELEAQLAAARAAADLDTARTSAAALGTASDDERLAAVAHRVSDVADLARRLARDVNPGGTLLTRP